MEDRKEVSRKLGVAPASKTARAPSKAQRVGLRPEKGWHKRNFLTQVLIPSLFTKRLGTHLDALLPNLADFQVHHPKIKVRLISGTDSVELSRSQEDVRIRYGHGQWSGVESTLLFRDQLRPVCSPKLLDPEKRPYPISVLKDHVFLHQEFRHNDWPDWLACAGGGDITAKSNVTFEELSVAYQAAISGAGIVVAQRPYFSREIAEGQLFEPFDQVLHRDLGYYLTIPHERRDASQVVAFKDWLVMQFRQLDKKENETAPAVRAAPPVAEKRPAANYKFNESRAA